MIYNVVNAGRMRDVVLAEFSSAEELSRYVKSARYKHMPDAKWAGGTMEQYHIASALGDTRYVAAADAYVDKFANVALEGAALDLEYNTQVGILDYQAALAGDAACLFGPTHVENDRAPIYVFVDMWTSSTVHPRAMEMRGIAVLALARALSTFRPVLVHITTGMRHSRARQDVIVKLPVPTSPMDTSLASWMLGSPQVFRCGFLGAVFDLAGATTNDGIPRLSDVAWQHDTMGKFLAMRDGADAVVHLPYMMDCGQWVSEQYCISWVKAQLEKFAPPYD